MASKLDHSPRELRCSSPRPPSSPLSTRRFRMARDVLTDERSMQFLLGDFESHHMILAFLDKYVKTETEEPEKLENCLPLRAMSIYKLSRVIGLAFFTKESYIHLARPAEKDAGIVATTLVSELLDEHTLSIDKAFGSPNIIKEFTTAWSHAKGCRSELGNTAITYTLRSPPDLTKFRAKSGKIIAGKLVRAEKRHTRAIANFYGPFMIDCKLIATMPSESECLNYATREIEGGETYLWVIPKATLRRSRLSDTACIDVNRSNDRNDIKRIDENRERDSCEDSTGKQDEDEDGNEIAVSMCSIRGGGRNFVRLGMVFTPKEYRGHGYASRLVSETCRMMLQKKRKMGEEAGVKSIVLWADQDNPTSRKIYKSIGFEESKHGRGSFASFHYRNEDRESKS